MKTQKEIWNSIAPEWDEYKQIPSKLSQEFLRSASGKILDFGSGSGRHLTKIKKLPKLKTGNFCLLKSVTEKPKILNTDFKIKKGKMYLLDFSEKMIEIAKQKAKSKNIDAEFCVADMTKIPYENNFFDFAIAISSLHCLSLEQNKNAIKELCRVLKPEGKILVGVWNRNSKRFKRAKSKEKYIGWTDKGERYYYLFEEKEIHKLFEDAGFKIISTHNSEMMINFICKR